MTAGARFGQLSVTYRALNPFSVPCGGLRVIQRGGVASATPVCQDEYSGCAMASSDDIGFSPLQELLLRALAAGIIIAKIS